MNTIPEQHTPFECKYVGYRIIISAAILSVLTMVNGSGQPMTWYLLFYVLYSCYPHRPTKSNTTTLTGLMTLDLTAVGCLIATAGEPSLIFYPLMILIVLDNGNRYGSKYMHTGWAIASILLAIAIMSKIGMTNMEYTDIGMLVGLVSTLIIVVLIYANLVSMHNNTILLYEDRIDNLTHLATHDPLTKLPNRNLFNDRLLQSQEQCNRNQTPFAVMIIDLDQFKPVNDNYGHPVGDQLLIRVAERMTDAIRANDTIARIGGDEFAMIINDTNITGASIVAQNVVDAITQPITLDNGDTITIGASIGVAPYPDSTTSLDTLIDLADRAMYQAKRSPRTTFVISGDIK